MCDYCGCRRQPAIDELAEEHERLLEQVSQLRRLARSGALDDVAGILRSDVVPALAVHTAKEERGIFAELRRSWVADDRLDALVGEHREIEALIGRILAAEDGWRQLVAELADELAGHIVDEETDLFPYALYELTPTQWEVVEDLHRGLRARETPQTVSS
ncbi:MAG: hemerythrin domain-containing protein [Nitriliruptoraceae bacterium]